MVLGKLQIILYDMKEVNRELMESQFGLPSKNIWIMRSRESLFQFFKLETRKRSPVSSLFALRRKVISIVTVC